MRIKLLFFLSASLLLWTRPAVAQISAATLVGTVKDPTGAVVGGAKVEAKNNATGAVRSTTTDGSGEYAIPNLTAGRYAVTVTVAGFKTFSAPAIELKVAQRADNQVLPYWMVKQEE